MNTSIGRNIAALRELRALSQDSLAEMAGIKRETLQRLENGRTKPRPNTVHRVAGALRLTPEELATWHSSSNEFGGYQTQLAQRPDAHAGLQRPSTPALIKQFLIGKHLQVALDVSEIRVAKHLASVAAATGTGFIEIGDPLIKRFGMTIVSELRPICMDTPLVVEFASSDWIDDQIQLACGCGGDIIQIIGLTNETRLRKAVQCCRQYDVGVFVVVPSEVDAIEWCRTAEDAGVDGIAFVRTIDCFQSADQVLKRFHEVQAHVNTPLLIAGGFTAKRVEEIVNLAWNVVIIGSAIINATDPKEAISDIMKAIATSEDTGNG